MKCHTVYGDEKLAICSLYASNYDAFRALTLYCTYLPRIILGARALLQLSALTLFRRHNAFPAAIMNMALNIPSRRDAKEGAGG